MTQPTKTRLLVNLPPGFFETPALYPLFRRLSKRATIRRRSWNTPEEIEKDIAWAEAVIMWSWPVLTEELLAHAAHLRFAGHINISPQGAQAELARGIAVSEARHGWSPSVAELALTLMLTALRRVSSYHSAMWEGREKWVGRMPTDVDPSERQLTGRPVGIIGFGGIGRRLAELLQPFHTELRIFDPFVPADIVHRYNGASVPLAELVKKSDVIVLCASNTESSKHIMGAKQIMAMKRGALLVNVGRAYLVDMDVLYKRVKKGELFAALDVFEKEPLAVDSPWRKLPGAYLTPHRAGGILESVLRILTWLADDFEAFLDGRERRCVLTPDVISRI